MVSLTSVTTILMLLCLRSAAGADTQAGSIEFFSDDACTASVLSKPNDIRRDTCLPATSGAAGRAFIVKEKPYCADGTRPSLLLFEDCGCTDGIANYIPNAIYGDYGNGSCTPLLGGDFVTFVLACGDFQAPVRTVIHFSATFPSSSTTTREVCGMASGMATGTSTGTSTGTDMAAATTGSGSNLDTGMTSSLASSGVEQTMGSTTASTTVSTTVSTTTQSAAGKRNVQAGAVLISAISVLGLLMAL